MEPMDITPPPLPVHHHEAAVRRVVHLLRVDCEETARLLTVTVMDEAKRQVECMLGEPATLACPESSSIPGQCSDVVGDDVPHCAWCFDTINATHPRRIAVGCPVAFVCSQHIRTQVQKGRDDYTIRENIAVIEGDAGIELNQKHTLVQHRPPHYKTKYQFCTLNCVLAFAKTKGIDKHQNSSFVNSVVLTNKLHRTLLGNTVPALTPSPHWSLLRCFGGPLTRAVYRERIGNTVYVNHGDAMLPLFRAYGCLVEEKIMLR